MPELIILAEFKGAGISTFLLPFSYPIE